METFLWLAAHNSDSSISLLQELLVKPIQRTLELYLQYYYSHVSPRAKQNVVFNGAISISSETELSYLEVTPLR